MPAKLKFGVVGTSWYTEYFHLARLKECPEAVLYAICGRNRSRAEEMATKYAIPQVFTDYHEMIERAGLQALIVATPDDLHYLVTMAGLEAGLHVFCEKPLAMNSTQAKEMLDKAEGVGVKHMVCFTFRWLPFHKWIKRLIEEGYLGKWYMINIRYDGDYGQEYSWRFDKEQSNGILADLGSHAIDLARWYVGNITQVGGLLSTIMPRNGPNGQPMDSANDAAVMTLRFANGAQGIIQVSAVAEMGQTEHQQHVILYGEGGTLEMHFYLLGGGEVLGIRRGEKEFKKLEIPGEFFGTNEKNTPFDIMTVPLGHQSFIDAILNDRDVEPSFLDGYKAQLVIDAAMESHRQGKLINI